METLPDAAILKLLGYLAGEDGIEGQGPAPLKLKLVSRRFRDVFYSSEWTGVLSSGRDGRFLSSLRCSAKVNEGTSGTCYRTVSAIDGKVYALKRSATPEDRGMKYFVLREAATLRLLCHPNIIPLVGMHVNNNRVYVIQPFAPEQLDRVIRRMETSELLLPRSLVRKWMAELMDGLAYCHARGIVHRNIKPKHLMLKFPDGSTDLASAILQIVDFSLVRIKGALPQTMTAEVVTVWYRAPEVLLGGRYGEQVDIWSAGCIYAELITSLILYPAFSAIDALFRIFESQGTPTDTEWPGLESLPGFQPEAYPQFPQRSVVNDIPGALRADRQVLIACLQLCPQKRITAKQALALLTPASNGLDTALLDGDKVFVAEFAVAGQGAWNAHKERYLITMEQDLQCLESIRTSLSAAQRRENRTRNFRDTPRWLALQLITHACTKRAKRVAPLAMMLFDLVLHNKHSDLSPHVRLDKKSAELDAVKALTAMTAIACLDIAIKLEEITLPALEDLLESVAGSFTCQQINKREQEVVRMLDFRTHVPVLLDMWLMAVHAVYGNDPTSREELLGVSAYLHQFVALIMDLLLGQYGLATINAAVLLLTHTSMPLFGTVSMLLEPWERAARHFEYQWGLKVGSEVQDCVLDIAVEHVEIMEHLASTKQNWKEVLVLSRHVPSNFHCEWRRILELVSKQWKQIK